MENFMLLRPLYLSDPKVLQAALESPTFKEILLDDLHRQVENHTSNASKAYEFCSQFKKKLEEQDQEPNKCE